jgi:cytochrome b pre-mRNA-processing protein 3
VSLLSRLLGSRADDRAPVRPLWHRIVELSRDPDWYTTCGVADTVPGRFDAVTLVLSAVLLRLEREPELMGHAARLTELFVDDMDGQLRQSGVGDIVVGKHIGKLMGVLGGRLGAYREALARPDDAALTEVVGRNVSLIEGAEPSRIAARLRALAERLALLPAERVLAGEIA